MGEEPITVTVTIRNEADSNLLDMLAQDNWRDRNQQASAMIEAALQTQRAKNEPRVPRRVGARTQRTNGLTRTEVLA